MPTKKPTRTIEQILKDKERKREIARQNGKKGGRPPGSKNKPPEGTPTNPPPPPSEKSLDDTIRDLKAEVPPIEQPKAEQPKAEQPKAEQQPQGEQPQGEQQQPAPNPAAFILSGHLGLVVLDSLIAGGIAMALRRYGWPDIKKSELQLTDEEIERLTPIADEVAKLIVINPVALLAISLVGAYMSKIPARPKPTK